MELFKNILDLLSKGESFVLATILSRSGSAPRAAGTRMVVRSDASIMGTIGGGLLEAQTQALARDALEHGKALVKDFVLTAEDAGRMGMICGGQVRLLIQFVDGSNPANGELYKELVETLEARKPGWLITRIPCGARDGEEVAQTLATSDGAHVGPLKAETIEKLVAMVGSRGPEMAAFDGEDFLIEPLCHGSTVYIFGAGHISQKLAPLTRLVGFRTIVIDDREEFANRALFQTADEIIVLSSFENALQGLGIDQDGYIVLVTRGHSHDKTLLGEALRTEAGYIGMIGSRRKRDAVYAALTREGFAPEAFERVHSPIGLNIGAETPEEIAVCIAAELIQERAKRSR